MFFLATIYENGFKKVVGLSELLTLSIRLII
jgi:hypothetical protein